MKAIVVGAGRLARVVIRRLGDNWRITAVDVSLERLTRLMNTRRVTCVEGDGASRIVLRRAGLEDADAVIAATDDDEINFEICHLAHLAEVRRIVAAVGDPQNSERFRELGVTAVCPADLAARQIELGLESRRMSSSAFAHGRAEAIEFRIAEDSPVRGKRLAELGARSWIIGAVLRGDRLVIPHGDTCLETDDLVTVVGAGADFGEIVRTFTSGEARFPLNHGKRVAVALHTEEDLAGPFAEALYLARNTRASSLVVVHRHPDSFGDDEAAARLRRLLDRAETEAAGVEIRRRGVRGQPQRALREVAASESIGLLVVGAAAGPAYALARATRRPVLVSRGKQPYGTLLAPARRTEAGRAAARVALDLAMLLRADLHAIAVADPVFLAGPEAPSEPHEAIAWLEEDALVLGLEIRGTVRQGSLLQSFKDLGSSADCVVLAFDPRRRPPSWRARIARTVTRRLASSVLLVPVQDRV